MILNGRHVTDYKIVYDDVNNNFEKVFTFTDVETNAVGRIPIRYFEVVHLANIVLELAEEEEDEVLSELLYSILEPEFTVYWRAKEVEPEDVESEDDAHIWGLKVEEEQ